MLPFRCLGGVIWDIPEQGAGFPACLGANRSTGVAMEIPFRVCVAAGVVLLAGSCAAMTEVTLPALDASETREAEALVVQADYVRGFNAPDGVVRGAGEGALSGMGYYLDGIASSGNGAILVIVLAPILLPLSAAIGAEMAHSKEEVDYAVDSFNRVGQDKELLASIDRRFIAALGIDAAKQWACIEAASVATGEPCSGETPTARLALRPAFGLKVVGKYDPDIHFFGDVVAVASVEHAPPDANSDAVVEAKWVYREELGEFFELAKDDAALLRGKLDDILDRFAARIAEDLYSAPRPETFVRQEIPEGVVVRVSQGSDLSSMATHGLVVPSHNRSFDESCWINAVDGKATGYDRSAATSYRAVMVKAGSARLDMSCVIYTHRSSIDEKLEYFSIEISVEPGAVYETDGRTYKRLPSRRRHDECFYENPTPPYCQTLY